MKNTVIALLVTILLVAIANLLVGLGLFGASGETFEYKVLNAQQMDNVGFRAIAADEGIEVNEKGEINFPKEMVEKISKTNVLPRTITEVEKDGGWEFAAVTGDDHYVFRRQSSSPVAPKAQSAPAQKAAPVPAPAPESDLAPDQKADPDGEKAE